MSPSIFDALTPAEAQRVRTAGTELKLPQG